MSYIKELSYLVFRSQKLAEWSTFSTEFLGMEVHPQADGSLKIRMDDHAYRFVIEKGDVEELAVAGFQVGKEADLVGLEKHLKDHSIQTHRGTEAEIAARDVQSLLWFNDPEGLRIEVIYNPKITTDVLNAPLIPGGFVTGDQGLGHIAICTADIKAGEKFYEDVLGFRLSDYIVQDIQGLSVGFTFYHVNPRHHTLALAAFPQPNRLNHYMVEVKNIDVVGHALERAKKMDIPIYMALGRHPNDRMLSFYARTPSNFAVEFGCEGIEIRDEENWEVKTFDAISEWGHKF